LQIIPQAWAEPSLNNAKLGEHYQFIRMGYFTPDKHSEEGALIFNRTVTLKDSWTKEAAKH
jgi:glutaminyl-tRNA synthetase